MLVIIPHIILMPESSQWNLQYMFLWAVLPINMCIMFYANYVLLVPKFLLQKKYFLFVVINVPLLILLTYGTHLSYISFHSQPATVCHLASSGRRVASILALNVSPLLMTIFIATLLQMSIRWWNAEKARDLAELQKKDAELKNLRLQVSPHFLLNTLNSIYALTMFDQQRAQSAITSLSSLLRHMLYDNKKEKLNMQEEATLLRHYVDLMRIRLNENVKIGLNTDIPEPCHLYVAPLVIISLVENAFKHGVSSTMPSFISIVIRANEESIYCEVSNSNFPKTDHDHSGHGIGLTQLKERLDILYPGKYHWEHYVINDKNIYTSKLTIYDTQLCNY